LDALTDDAPTLAIGAVAFAPSDPRIIYAATEATAQFFTRSGMGMLKSSDGGKTWALLGAANLARAAVRRVQVHPTNPDIVEVTVSRGSNGRDSRFGTPGSAPFGILRSADGGTSWVRTLAGTATALEVHPGNFNNQYAAIANTTLGPNGLDNDAVGSVVNGIYRSTDGGQTWTAVDGPWGPSTATAPTVGRVELAIAPSNPNVLYASIQVPGTSGGLLGLYRTDNAWAATPTWIQVPTDATGATGLCGPAKCGYAHRAVGGPRRSKPAVRWRPPHLEMHELWLFRFVGVAERATPRFPSHGVVGQPVDRRQRRRSVEHDGFRRELEEPQCDAAHVDVLQRRAASNRPEFMLGGFRDEPPSVRHGSSAWRGIFLGSAAPREWGEAEVAVSSIRPETDWMAAGPWGDINRTLDGGKTGTPADAGIDKTSAAFVAPVRKCPRNDDVFVTGTNRVWRTNDFFSSVTPTWTPNGPPSTFPNARQSSGTIQAIAFFSGDLSCNTYAYGNHSGQVHITRDGGRTWTNLDPNTTLPARPVNSGVRSRESGRAVRRDLEL
jgi:photosystem II stability/assembly factor-like uncharacterized protein